MYKYAHQLLSHGMFIINNQLHRYNPRHFNLYRMPKHYINIYISKCSVIITCKKSWDETPDHIKRAQSVNYSLRLKCKATSIL